MSKENKPPGGPRFDFLKQAIPPQVVCCPVCGAQDFRAWTNQYGVHRQCKPCGNEWSGSTIGVGRLDHRDPLPLEGQPAPEEDRPVVQYTGAEFRNPKKIFGGDDE